MPPWWRIRQGQGRERVKRYRRRLTAQQKKERRQDNSRRLVCQHLSDSLCSLNRIGRKQPQCRLDRASLFFQHPVKLSTCSVWGIWCACIYTHVDVAQSLTCLTNTALPNTASTGTVQSNFPVLLPDQLVLRNLTYTSKWVSLSNSFCSLVCN